MYTLHPYMAQAIAAQRTADLIRAADASRRARAARQPARRARVAPEAAVTEAAVTEAAVTGPAVTDSGAAEPRAAQPTASQPREAAPGVIRPGAASRRRSRYTRRATGREPYAARYVPAHAATTTADRAPGAADRDSAQAEPADLCRTCR